MLLLPTRAGVSLLPCSFGSLASVTVGKKKGGVGGGAAVVVVFIVTPQSWPTSAAPWTDHKCINN